MCGIASVVHQQQQKEEKNQQKHYHPKNVFTNAPPSPHTKMSNSLSLIVRLSVFSLGVAIR